MRRVDGFVRIGFPDVAPTHMAFSYDGGWSWTSRCGLAWAYLTDSQMQPGVVDCIGCLGADEPPEEPR